MAPALFYPFADYFPRFTAGKVRYGAYLLNNGVRAHGLCKLTASIAIVLENVRILLLPRVDRWPTDLLA